MNDEIDRQDMDRKLVKMTSEEFATGVNAGFRRSYQEWVNRDALLMALLFVAAVGYMLYRYFS